MIDILPPSFHGTEEERLDQIERYLAEFHDTLERKLKNIDMCDLNYDLAEKVRRKANFKLQRRPRRVIQTAPSANKDVSFWGYEDWAPEDISFGGKWKYAQETCPPNYLLTFGYVHLFGLNEGDYYFDLRRAYSGSLKAFFYGASVGVTTRENDIPCLWTPASEIGIIDSEFIIIGEWDSSYYNSADPLEGGYLGSV